MEDFLATVQEVGDCTVDDGSKQWDGKNRQTRVVVSRPPVSVQRIAMLRARLEDVTVLRQQMTAKTIPTMYALPAVTIRWCPLVQRNCTKTENNGYRRIWHQDRGNTKAELCCSVTGQLRESGFLVLDV